jgi:hypothetical protein
MAQLGDGRQATDSSVRLASSANHRSREKAGESGFAAIALVMVGRKAWA